MPAVARGGTEGGGADEVVDGGAVGQSKGREGVGKREEEEAVALQRGGDEEGSE